MTTPPGRGGGVPGRALLRLEPAAAAALIAVNDLWIKPQWPGLVAGKLSDIGICFLMPVVLFAALEWLDWAGAALRRRPLRPGGATSRTVACVVTTVYFAAMQIFPWFAELHESLVHSVTPWRPRPEVLADPSDLVALVMVPVAWLYLKRFGPEALRESDE